VRPVEPIVIVGAGHAGVQLAASLRQMGSDRAIALINDEPYLPYNRPPLSKEFLKSEADAASICLRSEAFFRDNGIDLVAARVEQIDRNERNVALSSGGSMTYGHLVFATGARRRPLELPHGDHPNICYLRSVADGERIRRYLKVSREIVVVGAGFIGLEFAATAAAQGLRVQIVELGKRFMGRAVSSLVSAHFETQHASLGSEIHFGRSVTSIVLDDGRLVGITLDDGRRLSADLIVVGVGVVPNIELAASADLPTENGIVVDDKLATCDPNVSAIGDCAIFASRRYGAPIRIEAVSNSVDQAKFLAGRLMGASGAYDAVPWFWSNQGRSKLQIAGLARNVDQVVVRGSVGEGTFSAFCYASGKLMAVESVSRPGDHVIARRLLAAGTVVRPDQAADVGFDLKACLAS
jgi:3-phenylpropionate/trans-cinnamate dioxygenase ferredoxin reductase component